MEFVNWEGRPAVILDVDEAFAVLDRAVGWVPVTWIEVVDSGGVLSEGMFCATFPGAPPFAPPAEAKHHGKQ